MKTNLNYLTFGLTLVGIFMLLAAPVAKAENQSELVTGFLYSFQKVGPGNALLEVLECYTDASSSNAMSLKRKVRKCYSKFLVYDLVMSVAEKKAGLNLDIHQRSSANRFLAQSLLRQTGMTFSQAADYSAKWDDQTFSAISSKKETLHKTVAKVLEIVKRDKGQSE